MLPGNLPTLLSNPRQQALDLPVRRTEATRLDQVFQGCVKLSEWGQTSKKQVLLITDGGTSGASKKEKGVFSDLSASLPAAAFSAGSCVKGFIGFGFQLKRLGGKLLRHLKIL